MRVGVVVAVGVVVLIVGCGGQQTQGGSDVVPPFELRPVAWVLFLDDYPEMGKAVERADSKSLGKALTAFHSVVNDRREKRDAKQTKERRRACRKAWNLLSQEMRRNKELENHLLLARAYLGAECKASAKSLSPLRRFTKRHRQADPLFYEAHFWHAESLLAMDRGTAAVKEYRWILGEIESPLYPLALLRTAHCHWDQGEQEEAREYLQHVIEWIGDKNRPMWIRSLKQQVEDDLESFSQ